MITLFINIWNYKNFITTSIKNEFVARFTRSTLGGLWMILHPLSQVLIYALVLSAVLKAKLPNIQNQYSYAIYLTAGMLGWSLFNEIITRCLTIFIEKSNLIKKLQFPKVTLPAIVIGSAILNHTMLLFSIILIFALLGHMPSIQILWLPLLTIVLITLSISIGLIAGILNIFIRDIEQVIPIILQVTFWFTPIVYSIEIIPEKYKNLLYLNPLFPIIKGFQDVLVYSKSPNFSLILPAFAFSVFLLLFSLFLFRKASPEMVDVL